MISFLHLKSGEKSIKDMSIYINAPELKGKKNIYKITVVSLTVTSHHVLTMCWNSCAHPAARSSPSPILAVCRGWLAPHSPA